MTDVLQFAILGLGLGSVYALLGSGLVLIYRGSGTINLAHGHFAVLAAYLVVLLRDDWGLPTALTVPLAIVLAGVLGALIHLLVMRPLRAASPLSRVIATLGLLTVINETLVLIFGSEQKTSEPVVPTDAVHLGDVVVGRQAFYLVAVAILVTVGLMLANRTRWGLALAAASDNPRAAAALGWSPDMLAITAWSLGGALAGLAGVLVLATTSGYFTMFSLSLLIIGALAVALFAQFRSFPLALLGGWLIAVVQSEAVRFVDVTGAADAVPFLFIVVLLVIRGRGLPVRGTDADRLPTVGSGRIRPVVLAVLVVAAVVLLETALMEQYDYLQAVVVSASLGIVVLSVVVLTGYAGQLSLAQMGLAGIGAYVAGRLVATQDWGFLPALVAGVVAATVAGLAVGLPALRTRGVNLTVVTFGLGFAAFALLFSNSELTGGANQTQIPPQTLFGLAIDPTLGLHHYASVCVVAFALAGVLVSNLRRGRVGRRLLAVRVNERAAASIGVSVFGAKLYAFAVAAGLAGLGGVLFAFSYSTILYPNLFGPFSSVQLMTAAVIGGVGYALGAVFGAQMVTGGVALVVVAQVFGGVESWVPLVGGIVLILMLIVQQNGIAAEIVKFVPAPLRGRQRAIPLEAAGPRERIEAQPLEVRGVTQRFGGVTALAEVSLIVEPGKVLGLLGPNGAGKTTLVDVVTGYARPAEGQVLLGGTDITRWSPTRRARAGLARTFQSLELFDDLTVRENLLAACEGREWSAYVTDVVRPGRGRLTGAALAAIEELELADVLDRPAAELSYGRRRLVALARAVATAPGVLLLDEPGAGLDQRESAELGRLVRRLAQEWGMAVLLIEHDVTMVLDSSDVVHVLDFGRTIFTGDPDGVAADDQVRRAYLGTAPAQT